MSAEETKRVLELQFTILESFSKIKRAIDELGTLSKIDTLLPNLALQSFAAEMLTVSQKLAAQHNNRMAVDDMLNDLKNKETDDDTK